jgi:hypothetical protein
MDLYPRQRQNFAGVEFEMTDGTHTRRCFISQQEIDKWAGHVGKIDQNIAFELFGKHAEEMCAAASRRIVPSNVPSPRRVFTVLLL